ILCSLAALAISQVTGCAMYLARSEVEFQKSMDFAGIHKVVVETGNGSIDVQCDPARKDVDIQATKYSRGVTPEDARQHAEDIDIDADRDPGQPDTLRIVAHWPHDDAMRGRGARFRVCLPPEAALCLRTSNGHVTTEKGGSAIDIETSNGRVTVTGSGGPVRANTSNGSMFLTDIAGDVDVKSSNGDIEIDRAGKASVRAVTSNGSIRAIRTSGNAFVHTSNGSVELRLTAMPQNPEITARSSNGRVIVEAPSPVSARLRMRTSNGHVHADLQ